MKGETKSEKTSGKRKTEKKYERIKGVKKRRGDRKIVCK